MNEEIKLNADLDTLTFNEVQLLLAEKRTALSTLRTGIAVFAFPLSVLSVLIATSRMYEIREVLHWLVPLLILNLGLIALGILSHHSRGGENPSLRPLAGRIKAQVPPPRGIVGLNCMTTILIATRNAHKVEEIRAILGGQFQFLTLKDFPNAPAVVEDADTFAGNATKKPWNSQMV